MNSHQIKSFFKNLGIPVKCQIVPGKNPFFNIWIRWDDRGKYEFPIVLRRNLLRVIYGDDCHFAPSGNAGNVRPHNLSISEFELLSAIDLGK